MSANKQHVFQKEAQVLKSSKTILGTIEEQPKNVLIDAYQNLHDNYALLLGDAKLVTSVSDRLQNKLNNTNQELSNANDKIIKQNEQLKKTIIQLKEAKLEKKATTIVLLLAVVLFLVSEAFIEPQIEKVVDDWYYGLGLKGLIALTIKPLEILVERFLMKKAKLSDLPI